MGCTIYGNVTTNGICVDDLIDNHDDIVYAIKDKHFARLVYARDNIKDEPKPAIAAFNEDAPFTAIYAKVLLGSFETYWNDGVVTESFSKELDLFIEDFWSFTQEKENNYGERKD